MRKRIMASLKKKAETFGSDEEIEQVEDKPKIVFGDQVTYDILIAIYNEQKETNRILTQILGQ